MKQSQQISQTSNTEVTVSANYKAGSLPKLVQNSEHLTSKPQSSIDEEQKSLINIEIDPRTAKVAPNTIVIMPNSTGSMPEMDRESSESSPERAADQLKVDRKIKWQPNSKLSA